MILTMLVSLYTVRVVLIVLGIEDYGIYNAIGGVVATMSFLTQVLANASQRFFAIELGKGNEGNIQEYFNSILFAYIIISLIILFIAEVTGLWLIHNKMTIPPDRLDVSIIVFHISLLTFITSVMGTPFNALIIANEEMNVFAYISIFDVIAKLVIVFLLTLSPIDKLVTYAILLLIVSLFTCILYIYFCRKKTNFEISIIYNNSKLKEIISYSSWTLVGTISGMLSIQGNSIILNIFCGPIANAAFAISLQISNMVQNFASSFFTAVRPPLTKSFAGGEYEYMMKLFYFSNKVIFVLVFAIIMPLIVETEFVLTIWLSKTSTYMVSFVRIMLVYALILCLNNPITTIVQAAGKVKAYHGVVDGFALLILPISYYLLKCGYNPSYALLSMVLIFVLSHILRLIILSRVIEFSIWDYFIRFILPCFFMSILCIICASYIKNNLTPSLINNILIVVLSFIMVIIMSFFIIFSNEERMQSIALIKKRY